MPQDPDAAFEPAIDLDIDKTWIVQLRDVEEREPAGKFKKRRPDEKSMIFHFSIHDPDTGIALIDENTGDVFDHWHWTPDSTFANPTTGEVAKARALANVLMDKTLTNDEIKALNAQGWDRALTGKAALADFERTRNEAGSERLRIVHFKPYRKPPVASVNGPASETPEQKRARLLAELAEMGPQSG